jgi:ATP-dependent DNA ligase
VDAVRPPLDPMLARLVRLLPEGPGLVYEPKWDGFRSLVFRTGSGVDMRSRHDRPLARYFPELVEAFLVLGPRFVLDGEILVTTGAGFDFSALLARLHPAASRVERLRRETPASFVAFDVLALDGVDLRESPFTERRAALAGLLDGAPPPLFLTPATEDPGVAAGWLALAGGGVDGVVAKAPDLRYQPGKRAMVKVKAERTADCVVAGYRLYGDRPVLSTLLLGLHDGSGHLHHVGVAGAFREAERVRLQAELAPYRTALAGHPWAGGFGLGPSPLGRLSGAAGRWSPDHVLDWVPLRPELVAEVAYDQLEEGRFRHPARFRRWRPDREARSCTFEQFEADRRADPGLLLGAGRA